MSREKRLLIKYGVFGLFLMAGVILFFIGVLNGGFEKDGNSTFTIIAIAGFALTGLLMVFICFSLMDDF